MEEQAIVALQQSALENKKERLKKALQCAICHDVFVEPVTLMCQHTFCLECLTKAAATIPSEKQQQQQPDLSITKHDVKDAVGLDIPVCYIPYGMKQQQQLYGEENINVCPECR